MKVALVGSSGGHLTHLLRLRAWWGELDRFWVTFDKPDARSALEHERVYWCHYPTNRHVPNLVRNTWLALKVLRRESPDLVFSTGAGSALPYFALAKLFGAKTAYLEVYDRVTTASLTGRLVYPITDHFFVQWPEQLRHYPRAELVGELF